MDSKQRNEVTAALETQLGRLLTSSEQKFLLLAETVIEKHALDDSPEGLPTDTSD